MIPMDRTPLKYLRQKLPEALDLLVFSASYEARSKVAALALPPDTAARVIVCANNDVQGAGKNYATEIATHFGERAVQVRLSKTNPVDIADAMIANIGIAPNGNPPIKCAVDISTFTHEALLILLRVLQFRLPAGSEVIYIYTPATEYDPGVAPDAKWLSRGLGEVRSVLGYSGTWLPSKKIHLIVLVGFESDRACKLIEAYEPDALSLGTGCVGPLSATLEDVRKVFYQEIAEVFQGYSDFEFAPGDPFAVRDVLLAHIEKFPDYNTVIAPMNTKISTIGAAMAAFKREDVQLTYGSAGIYNTDNYSIAADYCIVFTTPSFPI